MLVSGASPDRHSKSAKLQLASPFRSPCPIRSNLPAKQAPSTITEHALSCSTSDSITDTIRLIIAHLGPFHTSCGAFAHPSLSSSQSGDEPTIPTVPSTLTLSTAPYQTLPSLPTHPAAGYGAWPPNLHVAGSSLWLFSLLVQPGGSATTYGFYFDRQQRPKAMPCHASPSMIHPPEQSSDPKADSPEHPLLVRGIHDPSPAR